MVYRLGSKLKIIVASILLLAMMKVSAFTGNLNIAKVDQARVYPLTRYSLLVSGTLQRGRAMKSTMMVSADSSSGPAVLDRPETIKEKKIEEDVKSTEKAERTRMPGWEVRLWNDPFNKREFVARCLSEVCGKSDTESFQIMMHAHKNGMGVIGLYEFEIAELYQQSLQENGLLVDMVPVDDE